MIYKITDEINFKNTDLRGINAKMEVVIEGLMSNDDSKIIADKWGEITDIVRKYGIIEPPIEEGEDDNRQQI